MFSDLTHARRNQIAPDGVRAVACRKFELLAAPVNILLQTRKHDEIIYIYIIYIYIKIPQAPFLKHLENTSRALTKIIGQ